jgi:hypothetical protein
LACSQQEIANMQLLASLGATLPLTCLNNVVISDCLISGIYLFLCLAYKISISYQDNSACYSFVIMIVMVGVPDLLEAAYFIHVVEKTLVLAYCPYFEKIE